MLRTPSIPLHEYDDLSSPDPLATSFNDENNALSARFSSPARRAASPSKYSTILQDVQFSTPRKNARTNTHPASSPSKTVSEQTLSPWKIRVTVEAEPEDMMGNTRTMTRTVKIPLREASSPIENMNIDKRGRKSQPGTVKSRRSGTPSRGRSNSRSRRQSVTDLDIVVLGDDGDSNDWTEQRSPRKRKPRQSSYKRKEKNMEGDPQAEAYTVSEPVSEQEHRPRGKKAAVGQSFQIREDSDDDRGNVLSNETKQSVSPELRMIDLNRVSMRSRSASARQKASPPKDDTIEALMSAPAVPERPESARHVSHTSADSYPTPTPSIQSEEESAKEQSGEESEPHDGFDTILESEGFTMIDLESIPSARHFVTSPSTRQPDGQEKTPLIQLSVAQGGTGYAESAVVETPATRAKTLSPMRTKPTPIPSYLILQEGESDISSNVPSSPPVATASFVAPFRPPKGPVARQVTPQPYSSPRLPSPPKIITLPRLPIHQKDQKAGPPTLARVVKAGIALQGVLSPKPATNEGPLLSPYQRSGTPKERLDDLFEGFDSGTRRELRAGLRLGEELAKRQRSSPGVQSKHLSGEAFTAKSNSDFQPHSQSDGPVQVWRGENVVQHTPTPSIQQNVTMQEKRCSTPVVDLTGEAKRQKQRSGDRVPSSVDMKPADQIAKPTTPSAIDTMGRREREWQIEREAVSREIENASSSQVILIESDDENVELSDPPSVSASSAQRRSASFNKSPRPVKAMEVEQDDGDVWLEEADACNSSSSNLDTPGQEAFPREEQRKQRERAKEAISRPRRGLIPSPWKRGQDVADASTFLTNGDMTGLFFQQEKDVIKFGAGDIERQKRQTSSSFGVGSSAEKRNSVQEQSDVDDNDDDPEREEPEQIPDEHHQNEPEDEDSEAEQSMLDGQLGVGIGSEDDDRISGAEVSSVDEVGVAFVTENSAAGDLSGVSYDEASSLPPQPIKIPVNFNDSSLSQFSSQPPPLSQSSPSQVPESSRPSTPRSAIKGSRPSLGLDSGPSSSTRKVLFSERSTVVDVDGCQDTETLRSASSILTPRFEVEKEVVELVNREDQVKAGKAEVEKAEKKDGWLSWVWGNQKAASSHVANTKKAADVNWEPAKSSLPSQSRVALHSSSKETPTQRAGSSDLSSQIPSYLRPPSYPSDPKRDPNIPLATHGEFTNTHFRSLNIIYAKSLRPRFHAPRVQEARLEVRQLVGEKFSVDESGAGMGVFEWAVGEREVRVVERFMREVEFGYISGGKEVRWGWSEREVMERLFRIVVGEVVRAEEGEGWWEEVRLEWFL